MATLMLEAGADVRHIQEILGHAELSTTALYTRVSITQLQDVHRRTLVTRLRRGLRGRQERLVSLQGGVTSLRHSEGRARRRSEGECV